MSKTDMTKAPQSIETYLGTMHIGGDALGIQRTIDKWIENDKNGIPPLSGKEKAWRLKYIESLSEPTKEIMTNESKHPMTLQEAKDQVAQKHHYDDWAQIKECEPDYDIFEIYLCEAAELYASSKTRELREINKELLESLEELYSHAPDIDLLMPKKSEFNNSFTKSIFKAKAIISKAKALQQ